MAAYNTLLNLEIHNSIDGAKFLAAQKQDFYVIKNINTITIIKAETNKIIVEFNPPIHL